MSQENNAVTRDIITIYDTVISSEPGFFFYFARFRGFFDGLFDKKTIKKSEKL